MPNKKKKGGGKKKKGGDDTELDPKLKMELLKEEIQFLQMQLSKKLAKKMKFVFESLVFLSCPTYNNYWQHI